MSGGVACKCTEKREPIDAHDAIGPDGVRVRPGRLWRVMTRNWNYSRFVRGGGEWSAYSTCTCLRCGAVWRTKSDYVGELPDIIEVERNVSCGQAGHLEAMARLGRTPHEHHGGE